MPGFEDKEGWSELKYRVRPPGDFEGDTFRRKALGKGVSAIMGKLSDGGEWAVQALRFDKDEWTMEQAKAWVKEHREEFAASAGAELLAAPETYRTVPKVLFRPGFWQGRDHTIADCVEMVRNFAAYADKFRPAVTLGHDPEQPMAKALGLPFDPQGYPKLGYLEECWWDPAHDDEGGAVVGVFAGLPELLAQLINAGRYEKPSIVLASHVLDESGAMVDNVIAEVAFLGANPAAMWDQKDSLRVEPGPPQDTPMAEHVRTFASRLPGTMWAQATFAVVTMEDGGQGGTEMSDEKGKVVTPSAPSAERVMLDGIVKALAVGGDTEVMAKLEALVAQAAKSDELAGRMEALEAWKSDALKREKQVKVHEVVSAAVAAGKVLPREAPGMEAFAAGLDDSKVVCFAAEVKDASGKVTSAARQATPFMEYLTSISTRPVVIKFGENGGAPDPNKPAIGEDDKPRPEEMKAASSLGVKVEDLVAERKKREGTGGA
jgi:hypothetical protein